ncbi:MAG: hypothetical protein ACJAYU_002734 [Bradymonadia bacterium]
MTATDQLEADYLVVGAGAMGVAFVDELLTQQSNAQVILVEQRARPGGHWNSAYPFVSLHQPAAFYGVCSEPLGTGGTALASGGEVLAYFGRVVAKWVATGRLRFFPMCSYVGDHRFVSALDPERSYQVTVRKKLVDASYMTVSVPATSPPKYEVADEVALVPPNHLGNLKRPWSGYVVIGGGKTGIDAVLFLLSLGVSPDIIRWIIPNDSWFLDRDDYAPGSIADSTIAQLELLANAETLTGLFDALERDGRVLRLDPNTRPRKYRCATVNARELEALRSIRGVVRLGRVERIEPTQIVLEQGVITTDASTLHVDCTADGLAKREALPVFDGELITLQSVFVCQQVFSAALLAYLETNFEDDVTRNSLAQVIPHPEFDRDYVAALAASIANAELWARQLPGWLRTCRLFLFRHESWWNILRCALALRRLTPRLATAVDQLVR